MQHTNFPFPIFYIILLFILNTLSYLKEEIILVSLYHAFFHLYRNIIIIYYHHFSTALLKRKWKNKTQKKYVVLKRITFKSENQTVKRI